VNPALIFFTKIYLYESTILPTKIYLL